ncbi:Uncharacterized protein APZ42_020634 [Daphnia magna]|uniref:Uncharacterized protein n=1 Tax=Daphnia magna TaxID=35525 RepID=A0A164X9S7_9CRUS|nr:Uncharacterized protein APZ42_020634 [Daphnia magna]
MADSDGKSAAKSQPNFFQAFHNVLFFHVKRRRRE